jgi:DNA modification methylase
MSKQLIMKDNFDYKSDLKKRLTELKNIEGFPIGKDEDILALSNPPFYTACPNPYINEFIEKFGIPFNEETDNYHREPFIGDISEGKNNPIYVAHSYHTKVPHKAIMQYINHYTSKNDIVFDGFSGTGMTGIAAQLTNRKSILSDLSPAATFITRGYNAKVNVSILLEKANQILSKAYEELHWVYETFHNGENNKIGNINYTLWSDLFLCPYCKNEFVFWDEALDHDNGIALTNFNCPSCSSQLTKNDCKRAMEVNFDNYLGKEIETAKRQPVLINYTYNNKKYNKKPDAKDFEIINRIKSIKSSYWTPISELPYGHNTTQPFNSHGYAYIHQLYTYRNLLVLSCLWDSIMKDESFSKERIMFSFTAMQRAVSNLASVAFTYYFHGGGGAINAGTKGTYFVASITPEVNVFESFKLRLKSIKNSKLDFYDDCIINTGSTTSLSNIPANSIDYIFTDPPFGENIMYSELNLLWENWLKVKTDNTNEAIINKTQDKDLGAYSILMEYAFKEYYRVLKPNRWITIVFHNSKSSVWNAIQHGIIKAGFVIAQVSTLDKKQNSFKQYTSIGAVKNDLVISAYKPSKSFEEGFLKNGGEGLEIDFIHEFLHQQPIRPSIERTDKMLYSKMLSYYIQHGYEVSYDAKGFYQLLHGNFAEEDGYWFNAGQINSYLEYKKNMKLEGIDEIKQGAKMLFITDEKSAL